MLVRNKLNLLLLLLFCPAGAGLLSASQMYLPFVPPAGSAAVAATEKLPVMRELQLLKMSYPDVKFSIQYDMSKSDWCLTVANYGKTTKLYRDGGRYVTEVQLVGKVNYRPVLVPYERSLSDPLHFSDEKVAYIKSYCGGSPSGGGTVISTALFSAIYDASTQPAVESHLTKILFLGKPTTVHERIVQPLMRVESRIKKLALTVPSVAEFCNTLLSTDSYGWSPAYDADSRSFRSYGIGLDLLPKGWEDKVLYWKNEQARSGDKWMLTPLSKRWTPPEPVIRAFEEEGFVWGGRRIVWNNMHFEYHPELVNAGGDSSSVGAY
jgi:hypothetical protein